MCALARVEGGSQIDDSGLLEQLAAMLSATRFSVLAFFPESGVI
jgi:hypothetical protein